MENCTFCQIANHTLPAEFVYEDKDMMVFPDIHPVKPVHLLIVPKKHMTDFMEVEDSYLWNRICEVSQEMIKKFDLTHKGFRLSLNGGGAQKIDHLHLHLTGPMGRAV